MMIFEKAIEDAANMFLFDRRSQQQLHEMAEATEPGSKDRFLIRLTQAAFTYYNDFEAQGWDIRTSIRQAQIILREVKQYREDRVFFTLALRMEVDILLHNSRLKYQSALRGEKLNSLYNEEDERAYSICESLLKNIPENLEPLPNAWYTSLLPLFPTFHDEVLKFYGDRVKENRLVVLENILRRIQEELITAQGIILAKKFLSRSKINLNESQWMYNLLLSNVRNVIVRLDDEMPVGAQVVSDINVPKGISQGQLELAVQSVEKQIEQADSEMDMQSFTAHQLQLGILNFLRGNEGGAVHALVDTLRASENLAPDFKKIRQYRHNEFSDIPFMIGTSFLRLELKARKEEEYVSNGYLEQSICGLMRAVQLNGHYHQAYVNLMTAMHMAAEPGQEEVIQMYLKSLDGDIAEMDTQLFRNLAVLEKNANGTAMHSEAIKWLLLSYFGLGGELTKGRKMLQDLKTLYILNAHEVVSRYLESYRNALRQNDEEFIADMEDDAIHSAVLFHIAHAFGSRSLGHGKNNDEVVVEHGRLEQSIELNTEALFFNPENAAALRLVETQISIIEYALNRSEKRWEQISTSLSNRFTYYEDYLREVKSRDFLKERLESVNLGKMFRKINISKTATLNMDVNLTTEQKDRLHNRVVAT